MSVEAAPMSKEEKKAKDKKELEELDKLLAGTTSRLI